jgi:hypothetical protein
MSQMLSRSATGWVQAVVLYQAVDVAWLCGFRPATREWGWAGSVLDHPPPTSSAGGQAPEGRLWWGGWHGMWMGLVGVVVLDR